MKSAFHFNSKEILKHISNWKYSLCLSILKYYSCIDLVSWQEIESKIRCFVLA